jgi:erythromycin esterase-like protein
MAVDPAEDVRHAALWFESESEGVAPVLESVADARIVLIGEATHGTHEFYQVRADLTRALIERHGFNIVAAEADWPDAYRVNRWVRGMSDDPHAAASHGFSRSCEDDVVAQLVDLRRLVADYASRDGFVAEDEYFYALPCHVCWPCAVLEPA